MGNAKKMRNSMKERTQNSNATVAKQSSTLDTTRSCAALQVIEWTLIFCVRKYAGYKRQALIYAVKESLSSINYIYGLFSQHIECAYNCTTVYYDLGMHP